MNLDLTPVLAWAAQEGAPATTPPSPLPMVFTFVAIGVAFYFLFLRPQRKEQRKREEMVNQLAKGDQIVTIGGILGTVESIDTDNNIVTVAVAPKTNLKFRRSAISSVERKKGQPAKEDPGKDSQK